MGATPAKPNSPTVPLDARLHAAVERALAAFLEAQPLPENLRAACTHAVMAGGKRLRPLLVLESAHAAGGTETDAMPAAVAIELVHAFSLVHDDLPALDNDALRRGQPTCHVAFGEAMAILAGDCLLALAPLSAGQCARNAPLIQRSLLGATVRMIAGQVYDTVREFPAQLDDAARVALVHQNKTGALLECCCTMGALAADANEIVVEELSEFGATIGLMFQIVDDLIDATQTAETAGKATGKDREAGKMTYPAIHGLEGSRREVERLRSRALELLAPLGPRGDRLSGLVEFLSTRTS